VQEWEKVGRREHQEKKPEEWDSHGRVGRMDAGSGESGDSTGWVDGSQDSAKVRWYEGRTQGPEGGRNVDPIR
jgi:hypothetical protein